eukprot:EG_transcript_43774
MEARYLRCRQSAPDCLNHHQPPCEQRHRRESNPKTNIHQLFGDAINLKFLEQIQITTTRKGDNIKKHETLRNVFSSICNDLPKTPLVCCCGVCCCGTLTGTAPPESHRSVTLRWCSGQGPVASGVAGGRGG